MCIRDSPTAMHVAVAQTTLDLTLPALEELLKELVKKSNSFSKIIKIGRTHTQDATPLTLGQEFSGYKHQVEMGIKRIKKSLNDVLYLAQGGTAVGTGINTKKGFDMLVSEEIARLTRIPFLTAPNKFEALATHDALVNFSGSIRGMAASIFKISNDIRFLASGPRCGFGELSLPENEPGSSIMPGKVNPTQCEAVNMVYAQIIGNDNTISYSGANGNFQLNTYRPIIAFSIHESISLLAEVSKSFSKNALEGLKANKKKIDDNLNKSLMLVTALAPEIGYEKSAEIAKKALKENITLKESAKSLGYLSEQDFDNLVKPEEMVSPKKI